MEPRYRPCLDVPAEPDVGAEQGPQTADRGRLPAAHGASYGIHPRFETDAPTGPDQVQFFDPDSHS
ncbi:hypothetical protein GCM10010251_94730 [Streptomyces aurantiogriseus]|uniref:Uncharacterized protein n=1 Tax=Streptomyces aurantiogriseus TaxID=66870 RepID=A0A918L039_9ACTN|nr:hypothetical protein GCM10010251_94730 [Streptomyces aurantiogriseus]